MSKHANVRMAADIGGTFTDVVLQVGSDRRLTRKVLTTPDQPEIGMLNGLSLALQDGGLNFADVDVFVHGTTLATNAIIERRGARTVLVATEGFRDVLDIATESRFNQYDLMIEKPTPLIPRSARFTVPERIDATGKVLLPLDVEAMRALALELKDQQVEAIAVVFIHAYANVAHELEAERILREKMPDVSISLSHKVCPEVREYERTSTTVANAYVQPLMQGYLGRMAEELLKRDFNGATYLMTSGGGLTSLDVARDFPVRLVESGPAGGAIFASLIALAAGERNVLSFDMGGTTAKVCLIQEGAPTTSRFFEVDRTERFMKGSGLPLRIPVIEMVEIGAGGGSIAKVDGLGRIQIGPQSVSSKPGPACYDLGGDIPSVTDADLVLGLIESENFANGTMTLRPDLSRAALARDVGSKLGVEPEAAAFGIYEVVCENMASAARMHAAELGAPVDRYTMIAFGGAAPLHAARVAEKVGIEKVLIPANAGVGSAVGFLAAPVAYEVIRSFPQKVSEAFDVEGVRALLAGMERDARALVEPGAEGARTFERMTAYMRYVGQGHEIAVEIARDELRPGAQASLRSRFEVEYRRQFSREIPLADIEVLTWSVLVSTYSQQPGVFAQATKVVAPPPVGRRELFDGRLNALLDVPVYDRAQMRPGSQVQGPALIGEIETTIYVPAAFDARVDGAGNIVLEKKA
ncbi:hydantoinase/oxoprolinase family protein [Mesorhizobium microcysteis]|uniref:Hydantoinase/oxoprolinase family protein n=1 Tax=Neoaquamicrobium microcysteis TaxID=2682781 RepID=A0A5D4H4Z2_9HYPH|nr:hydantoinase/oxoprolinase family protein [Mesorhizobium microcysteis]TYR35896.1 hydantoinase/oxoprolinase family protein [Mesorhizobium microcysteis]